MLFSHSTISKSVPSVKPGIVTFGVRAAPVYVTSSTVALLASNTRHIALPSVVVVSPRDVPLLSITSTFLPVTASPLASVILSFTILPAKPSGSVTVVFAFASIETVAPGIGSSSSSVSTKLNSEQLSVPSGSRVVAMPLASVVTSLSYLTTVFRVEIVNVLSSAVPAWVT